MRGTGPDLQHGAPTGVTPEWWVWWTGRESLASRQRLNQGLRRGPHRESEGGRGRESRTMGTLETTLKEGHFITEWGSEAERTVTARQTPER